MQEFDARGTNNAHANKARYTCMQYCVSASAGKVTQSYTTALYYTILAGAATSVSKPDMGGAPGQGSSLAT